MDFELTSDQSALQEGMRNFCTGLFPLGAVRTLADVPGAVQRGAWRELGAMGTFSLRLPAADGGIDLGWADTVLAFEELGRALVPGPLVWTSLVAGFVKGAANGTTVVGGIDRDDPARLVEHASALDQLVVLDDEGAWLVDPSTLVLEPKSPLDPLTPVSSVVGELPKGDRLDGVDARAMRTQGAVLAGALLLGIAEAATDLALAYANERVQFDKPIGSFQAVKHILADMFTRTEIARAAVYAAGVTLDEPSVGSIDRAAAAAKLTAGEAAVANGKSCIQVHGGMGYTWEVDAHLFLKRAYVLDASFASRDDCADTMAELLSSAS